MVEKLINKKHGLGWRLLHLQRLTGCYSQETMIYIKHLHQRLLGGSRINLRKQKQLLQVNLIL